MYCGIMECDISQKEREQLLQQLLLVLNSDKTESWSSFHELAGGHLWRLVKRWEDTNDLRQRLLLWKACFRHVCEDLSERTPTVRFGTLQTWSDSLKADLRVYVVDTWLITLPLCLCVLQRQKSAGRRVLVGVGGVAAAGKTTWCQVTKAFLSFLLSCRGLSLWGDTGVARGCAVVGLDAFHFTNERLTQLGLRTLKGRPATFDTASFTTCVEQVKEAKGRHMLPAYDRALHNPVPDAIAIDEDVCIVLIEGLFVLLDDYGFHIHSLLDFSIFLHVDEAVCCQRAVNRKARTNSISKDDAMAHYKRVDGPNYGIITAGKNRADICLYFSSSQEDFCVDRVVVKDAAGLRLH